MYEGYKNQLLSRSGAIWQTTQPEFNLTKSEEQLTINITEIGKTYPTGHVRGHLSRLNG